MGWQDAPLLAADDAAAPDPAPPAATAEVPGVPAGWHVETIPDHNGVQRQYAVSPDNKAMVSLGGAPGGVGGGFAGAGTGTAGTGAAPPAAAPAAPGAQEEWAKAPEVPGALAPITDTGTTGGFADEAPVEASSQLSPQDEAALIEIARHPKSTADDLRRFAATRGHAIANADAVIEARDKGLGVNGSIEYPLPKPADPGTATDAFGRGLLRGPTLDTIDELQGAGAGLNALLHGQGYAQAYDQSVDQTRGQFASDEENHHLASLSGQLVGSLILPTGTEGVAFNAGREALRGGATMAEARVIAARAVARHLGTVGGVYGTAQGVGGADGGPGQRALGGLVGGLVGMAGGRAFGAAGEAIAPKIQAGRVASRALPLTEGQKYYAAGRRVGIEPFAADVGGPMAKRFTAGLIQTPFGVGPLDKAATAVMDAARAARDRTAAALGVSLRPEALGDRIRAGARATLKTLGASAGVHYNAAESESAGLRFNAPKALAKLDEHIAELGEDPAGSDALGTLQGIRDRIAIGDLTPRGLRSMRRSLRDKFVKDGLRGSDIERRVNQVVDAAADDIKDGLNAAGKPGAAKSFAEGDRIWRDMAKLSDQVFEPIIGTRENPRSGEAVVKTLMADLQGNNARAAKLLRSLPPDDQATMRASIISALGRPRVGGQDAEGEGFSLATFLSNWNDIGDTAKAAYFGPEARAALSDLAKVAEGAKLSQKYAGHSNTGAINAANLTSGGLGAAALAFITGHPLVAAGMASPAAYQAIGSRLLASPRFVRWLARAPRTSLGAASYIDRLSRIAVAEPAIANDVLQLQRRLQDALPTLSSHTRAAADKPLQKGSGVNQGNPQAQQQEQGSPAKSGNASILDQTQAKYPYIKQFNPTLVVKPNPKQPGVLETWQIGDEGTKDIPRPKELPMDRVGIQILKPERARPLDVAAEFLHADPIANAARNRLLKTLSPAQIAYLKVESLDYEDSLKYKETQQKAMENATDSALRSAIFGQDGPTAFNHMNYTPQQQQIIEQLRRHVTGRT